VQGKEIKAHKSIVCARSPTIMTMVNLTERFCNGQDGNTLVINNVKYPIFLALLHYLYTDHEVKMAGYLKLELGKAAKDFRVDRLRQICTRTAKDTDINIESSWATNMRKFVGITDAESLFANVCFNVQGKKVYANKAILVARSEYFKVLFQGPFSDSKATEFHVDEKISFDCFVAVLDYIYTGEYPDRGDLMVELLGAADLFLLDDLKQVCESVIEENALEVENVTWLLETADRYDAPRLKRSCIDLISQKWNDFKNTTVLAELKRLSPQLLREIDYTCYSNNVAKEGEVWSSIKILTEPTKA